MRTLKAFGKNVILKFIKEKEKETVKNGLIIPDVNKKPVKLYEVLDSNCDKLKVGMTVYLNAFVHAIEVDGNEYHICSEDAIAALLQ